MAIKNADVEAIRSLLRVMIDMHEHEVELAEIRRDLWHMLDELLEKGEPPDPVIKALVMNLAAKAKGKDHISAQVAHQIRRYRAKGEGVEIPE